MSWILTLLLSSLAIAAYGLDEIDWIEKSSGDGFTDAERTFMLDTHNYYRILAATCRDNIAAPGSCNASNIRRVFWNDLLEKEAQAWANSCGDEMHNDGAENHYSGQNYAGHGDRSYLIQFAFEGWIDSEQPDFTYGKYTGSAGHYTQALWAHTTEIGCGFAFCKNHKYGRLVCHYMVMGNIYDELIYKTGDPCSQCDQGYGFCFENALCTDHCNGKNCRCTVDKSRCKSNGGKFNSNKCLCECPSEKMGLHCEDDCEDTAWCEEQWCTIGEHYFFQAEHGCYKTCGKCKTGFLASLDNRRNYNIGSDSISDGKGGNGKKKKKDDKKDKNKPGCKDNDTNCSYWANIGECSRNPGWMLPNCKLSCDQC